LARSIRLDFLAWRLFRCENPHPEGWISLDSLVRIETYQWVARQKAGTIFVALFRAVSSARMVAGLRFVACGTAGLFMGQA
jgi:hypothetical protein